MVAGSVNECRSVGDDHIEVGLKVPDQCAKVHDMSRSLSADGKEMTVVTTTQAGARKQVYTKG